MRTSAAFTLMMPAAPRPCTARAAISTSSDDASMAPRDDTANRPMPSRYTRR